MLRHFVKLVPGISSAIITADRPYPLPLDTQPASSRCRQRPFQVVAAMLEDEAAPAVRTCLWCHDVLATEVEAVEIECSVCENYFVHRE